MGIRMKNRCRYTRMSRERHTHTHTERQKQKQRQRESQRQRMREVKRGGETGKSC